MGLSLVVEGLIHAALPEAAWRPLVANVGYTLDFLIVVLGPSAALHREHSQ